MKIKETTINSIYKYNWMLIILGLILIYGDKNTYFAMMATALLINAIVFLIKDHIKRKIKYLERLHREAVDISKSMVPLITQINDKGLEEWEKWVDQNKKKLASEWDKAGDDAIQIIKVNIRSLEESKEKLEELIRDEQYTKTETGNSETASLN